MAKRTQMAFGDHEEFDFYLSAFLSACTSVDYTLRHDFGDAYRAFWTKWKAGLQRAESSLLEFMTDDRNREVHDRGSSRVKQQDTISGV